MSNVLLYSPYGDTLKQRETVELPWGVMQRVIEFADLMNGRQVGLHCARCKRDFVASNGEHDPVLKMACGCREFWSTHATKRN